MINYILEAAVMLILYLLVMVVMAYEVFECRIVSDKGSVYYVVCDIGDSYSVVDAPAGKKPDVVSWEVLR